MSVERNIQAVMEWTPRWAQSERNWVVLLLVLSALSMLVAPSAVLMAYVLWISLRWAMLGKDGMQYHNLDPSQPPHLERLRVFSPAGRGVAIALFLIAASFGFVALAFEPPLDRLWSILIVALWLYGFYSHDFFIFGSTAGARWKFAARAGTKAPADVPLPERDDGLGERAMTACKALLLLNLGAYAGVAVFARAAGMSTGWPPDSDPLVMIWKGVSIAIAILAAIAIPFLFTYRPAYREDHTLLVVALTVVIAIWL